MNLCCNGHLRVRDTSDRISGGFDQNIDATGINHGLCTVEELSCLQLYICPTNRATGLSGAIRVKIGNGFDFKTEGRWNLA